jgi:predicted transcriptional regulator
MARLGLHITEEMEENLSKEAEKTHIAASELVRMAIEEFLSKRGHTFTANIKRGGWRGGPKDKGKE